MTLPSRNLLETATGPAIQAELAALGGLQRTTTDAPNANPAPADPIGSLDGGKLVGLRVSGA